MIWRFGCSAASSVTACLPCAPGYYCPAGSTRAMQVRDGSRHSERHAASDKQQALAALTQRRCQPRLAAYLPAPSQTSWRGGVAVTLLPLPAMACWLQAPCPAGRFSKGGAGDEWCDGLCREGFYCDAASDQPEQVSEGGREARGGEGRGVPAVVGRSGRGLTAPSCTSSWSTLMVQYECGGEALYCPSGSGAPIDVDSGKSPYRPQLTGRKETDTAGWLAGWSDRCPGVCLVQGRTLWAAAACVAYPRRPAATKPRRPQP